MYWFKAFAREICWRLSGAVVSLILMLSVFTLAAPQMSPQQVEREIQKLHGQNATMRDLIQQSNEQTRDLKDLVQRHMESEFAHQGMRTKVDAQGEVLGTHNLRFAKFDGVLEFVQWMLGIIVALMAVVTGFVGLLFKRNKGVVNEVHESRELLERVEKLLCEVPRRAS